ncbi:helix-turn-helix domain-containing protein [Ligilactobacillus agilis]|uniref:helix-turn-helix domain-containing protein n=1 Tax=Ligilactobacillus agilis TaxID=1601 RepID=UPI0022E82488|nr:helix-turn-helix transcriptional regulator [Ligilactobacillus agilis]
MTTYERIQELSKERGLSVRELGRKLDIGETTIYKWKTQTPKLDVLEKVADYFDVSVDYLVGRTDKKLPFDRWEKMYGDGIREEQARYNANKTSDLAENDVVFTFEGKKIPKEDLALIREIIKRTRKD